MEEYEDFLREFEEIAKRAWRSWRDVNEKADWEDDEDVEGVSQMLAAWAVARTLMKSGRWRDAERPMSMLVGKELWAEFVRQLRADS